MHQIAKLCTACHVISDMKSAGTPSITQTQSYFDQAENRMYMQKAMIIWLLEKEHLV